MPSAAASRSTSASNAAAVSASPAAPRPRSASARPARASIDHGFARIASAERHASVNPSTASVQRCCAASSTASQYVTGPLRSNPNSDTRYCPAKGVSSSLARSHRRGSRVTAAACARSRNHNGATARATSSSAGFASSTRNAGPGSPDRNAVMASISGACSYSAVPTSRCSVASPSVSAR